MGTKGQSPFNNFPNFSQSHIYFTQNYFKSSLKQDKYKRDGTIVCQSNTKSFGLWICRIIFATWIHISFSSVVGLGFLGERVVCYKLYCLKQVDVTGGSVLKECKYNTSVRPLCVELSLTRDEWYIYLG